MHVAAIVIGAVLMAIGPLGMAVLLHGMNGVQN